MMTPWPCSQKWPTMWFRLAGVLWTVLLLATAQQVVVAKEASEKRVALVIGNATYKESPLANPVNDAQDMALALKEAGFEVIQLTNATQKQMLRAISKFGEQLTSDSVALFYYAGHGMQVRGKNFLIPVDAEISGENSIRVESVDVDMVLDQLSTSELNVVILDACRNNPFERRFRSMSGGLAQMEAPKGSLIAYATAPGQVALDGSGRNGLYTRELLKQLREPNVVLEVVFKNVRRNVARSTRDQQIPWETSSLTGDFYFHRAAAEAAATSPKPSQPSPPVAEVAGVDKSGSSKTAAVSPSLPQSSKGGESSEPAGATSIQNKPSSDNKPSVEKPRPASSPSPGEQKVAEAIPDQTSRKSGESATVATASKSSPPTNSTSTKGAESPPPPPENGSSDKAKEAYRSSTSAASSSINSSEPGRDAVGGQSPSTPSAATPTTGMKDAGTKAAASSPAEEELPQPSPTTPALSDSTQKTKQEKDLQVAIAVPSTTGPAASSGLEEKSAPSPQALPPMKAPKVLSGEGMNAPASAPVKDKPAQSRTSQTVMSGFTVDPRTGQLSGTGTITWSNGDRFEGTLNNGIREGKGKFVWANGQQYDGEWANNRPNGKGVLIFSNGNKYEGALKDDQPHGKGEIKFVDGNRFIGDFVAGQPNGSGVMYFSNGDRYKGEVKDGFPHGQGTLQHKNGDVYSGLWVKGKQHGLGRYTWGDGRYWEGEFVDGNKGKEKSSSTTAANIGPDGRETDSGPIEQENKK